MTIAAVLFAIILPMIHEQLTQGMTASRSVLLVGLISLFGSCATFGLFALFLGTLHRGNSITRYLAEASFWVYLIHMPIVGLTHIAIAQIPISALAKFVIAGTTAMSLSLMTYHVFVRGKSLGAFLNGTRRKPAPVTEVGQPAIAPAPLKLSA